MRIYIYIFIHFHHSNPDTRRNSSLIAVNVTVDPERKLKARRLFQHPLTQTKQIIKRTLPFSISKNTTPMLQTSEG